MNKEPVYLSLHRTEVLDGLVDIYLPDFKYADSDMARKYSRDAVETAEGLGLTNVEIQGFPLSFL